MAGGIAAPSSEAAGTTPAAATATVKINPIQLGQGVTAALEDVNIWPQTGGNILAYTLKISNNSSSSANLVHFFPRVVTPGGSAIPANPVTADALKKKVGAKDSLRVTYYVNVGQTTSLQGMKIAMYVWDAKAKGYLKNAGALAIPAGYSTAAERGKILSTTMNDIPVTASADSLQLYKFSGKVYAKVGLSITNKGSKVLNEAGYTPYLQTASGTSFELTVNSAQAGYKIQPQEKKSIYYLAEIPAALNTNNMKLQFTQKDETLKLELPKMSFKLPVASTPNFVVNPGAVKKVGINSNTVEMQLVNASVYSEDAHGVWSFQLRLKNAGNKAVTLPNYELAVKSTKGTAFPVNAKALSGLTLKPLETKVVPLTVQVPLEVEQAGLQLQMIEAVSATETAGPTTGETAGTPGTVAVAAPKLIFPVAYFTIPYALRADVQRGEVYNRTNQFGSFSYNLTSLQRYPWKDDDIVMAKLNITNTQSVTLTLPELTGAIKLDSNDLAATTNLLIDKEAATLAPGKSAEIVVMSKVPYTEDFEDVRINLFSTVNTEKVPFLDLSMSNSLNAIDNIDRGGTYKISGKGKNANVQESRTTVYEGTNSKIVYTELLISSQEKRQSKMARLQAYYRTKDGQFFDAKPNQPDNAATPGGMQLVSFWAKLPKTVSADDISLVLGSGVTGNKLSESGQEATGFMNASALLLTPKTTAPASNLTKITFFPYNLSVINSEGRLLELNDTINIVMTYDLTRDNSIDSGDLEHKLVLRMTDPFGVTQDKVLTIGTDLTEGKSNTFSMSFSKNLYMKLKSGTYKLTLFDEFQGERQELGGQVFNLFIDRQLITQKDTNAK
ncbi:hypothetical protein BSK56_03285 [Paenibacillus borealis]|uniref:Uncharacterized protein n=1 Tax=Paenibacillus borealis TaxID=160799 RepID=A0ABX3HTC8_PAEBO|nr:hypothetical protein BSK56_03285 [Paenibacillus borealis]